VGLTPSQSDAVQRSGQDVCVVAGPGSGKTRVLVERFAWLIRHRKVSPLRILAITFTEKAATEIKQRVAKEFAASPLLRKDVERAYVSTVHGFCARLLREHPIAAGLDPQFKVLEEAQSAAELTEAVHDALDQLYESRPAQLRELLEAIHVSTWPGGRQPDMAQALCDIYGAMRIAGRSVSDVREKSGHAEGGLTLAAFADELRQILDTAPANPTPKQTECIDALLEWAGRVAGVANLPASLRHFELLEQYPAKLPSRILPLLKSIRDERLPLAASTLIGEFYAPLKAFLLDALELTDGVYRQRKRELGALDFSDLEERAIELLRSDRRVLDDVRERFDQILMDELQDTNPLQWRLVDLLRTPHGFFAVGDINQSIFGFRHAEPDVFKRYRESVERAGGKIDELSDNFRSRKEILAAVEAVTGHADGILEHHLAPKREFLPKPEPSLEVLVGFGEDKDNAERIEARWMARRIVDLVGTLLVQDGETRQRPARFRDMAVLVRTLNALPPVLEAFQAFGVPYLTEGGKTFYESRQARDLVQLLRVIANPEDELALAGVLRSPLAGIRDETLLRMKEQARSLARALSDLNILDTSSYDSGDVDRLRRFAASLARTRSELDDVSPDRLLLRAMDACDYESGLDSGERANVAKFLAQIRGWHSANPRPVDALIEDLAWLREAAAEAEAPPEDSSDVVHVMTMHKAKGLQFPVVVLPALHRGSGNTGPSICLSSEGSLGVWWRDPLTGQGVKDNTYAAVSAWLKEKERCEENRLLYVAMTRAEEHLVLSFAKTPRPKGGNWHLVTEGLAIDVETAGNQAELLETGPHGLPVRVLRQSEPTELVTMPAGAAAPRQMEPVLLARPACPDQHDSAASVTALQTFARCPRCYYLGQYIGWERPALPVEEGDGGATDWDEHGDLGAAEFGTLVHDLLAGKAAEKAPLEALDLVRRFQSSELGQRCERAARAEREFDFVMAVEDVVLRGRIDLWFEEGGELILLDYKTDQLRADDGAWRAEEYGLQLRLYALALERIAGRMPDSAFVYWMRTGKAVPIALDRPALQAAADQVRLFREAQSRLRFGLREGEYCVRCPYYGGLCPAGKKA